MQPFPVLTADFKSAAEPYLLSMIDLNAARAMVYGWNTLPISSIFLSTAVTHEVATAYGRLAIPDRSVSEWKLPHLRDSAGGQWRASHGFQLEEATFSQETSGSPSNG